jgi:CDGSH-type Zn-finger protein
LGTPGVPAHESGPVSGATPPPVSNCLAEDLREIAANKQAVSLTAYPGGPYLLRGRFTIMDSMQTVLDPGRKTVALCSCGRSRVKPFCDGSHKAARRWVAREGSDRNPVSGAGS